LERGLSRFLFDSHCHAMLAFHKHMASRSGHIIFKKWLSESAYG
jgi:hypothetical protein